MRYSTYILRRILAGIAVLFMVSILIFLLTRLIPGDPVRIALGERASNAAVAELREKLHFDDPLPVQYVYWLAGVFRGDLGVSLYTQRDVVADLGLFFPATLELVLCSLFIMTVFGFLLGTIASHYKDTWIDNAIRFLCYVGVSAPSFVWAAFFVLIFGYFFNLLPFVGRLSFGVAQPPRATGLFTIDSLLSGDFATFLDALKHLILPSIALAMAGFAQNTRITRTSMSDNLDSNFMHLGRLFNLPSRVLMGKYLLRLSVIPPLSLLGLEFGALLGNAFVVELVFTWPGFSRYGLRTILSKDLNAITIVVVIISAVYITSNILVDLAIAFIDPRIRLRGKND